jgi:hypothetical protein
MLCIAHRIWLSFAFTGIVLLNSRYRQSFIAYVSSDAVWGPSYMHTHTPKLILHLWRHQALCWSHSLHERDTIGGPKTSSLSLHWLSLRLRPFIPSLCLPCVSKRPRGGNLSTRITKWFNGASQSTDTFQLKHTFHPRPPHSLNVIMRISLPWRWGITDCTLRCRYNWGPEHCTWSL